MREELAKSAPDPAKVKAAKGDIAKQEGAMRDMPSALRGARIKRAIYTRAYTVLIKKVAAGPAAGATGSHGGRR